jgi:hypothetical protein
MGAPYRAVFGPARGGTLAGRGEQRRGEVWRREERMAQERRHEPDDAVEVTHRIEEADTLTDLGAVVPRELLEAARAEIENPADESDEG